MDHPGKRTGTYFLEPVVVSDSGDLQGVAREGERRERWPVEVEAAGKFGGPMLGVSRGTYVAEEVRAAPLRNRSAIC